jgi:hypothetical protein
MKYLLIVVFIFLFSSTTLAQKANVWSKWSWLIGEWQGEGAGKPGQGAGVFTLKPDLNETILVRKSHSVYPASGNHSTTVHDDLMIIYSDYSGLPSKAIYFDNEGHTINYSISYHDSSIIMTSEKSPNAPIFRLTYSLLSNDEVDTKFEMSQDGAIFSTYVEGKSKKIEN